MEYQYNDGGRAAAGYKSTRDCVCRAIAVATGESYFKIRCELAHVEESISGEYSGGNGIHTQSGTFAEYMARKGFVPELGFINRLESMPTTGTFLVRVPRHMFCVKDGVLYDTGDGRRRYAYAVTQVWRKI